MTISVRVAKLTAESEGTISLLCTIPGIDRRLAITIVSEIGTDMTEFGSSKRLCRCAGLTSGNNESTGKKKSVRISCAGVYLKPALAEELMLHSKPLRSVLTTG